MNKLRGQATGKLNRAIQRGELSRPTVCELCGADVSLPLRSQDRPDRAKPKGYKLLCNKLVGHHHAGYGQPLNVWWICKSCNRKLTGGEFHNGSVTKEEARKIVSN